MPPAECDPEAAIDALIFVRRTSTIPGQRYYARTVTSTAEVSRDQPSFALSLPVSPDQPYEITVVPSTPSNQSHDAQLSPVALAPPLTFAMEVSSSEPRDSEVWVVGKPDDYITIDGEVVSSVNSGVSGMKVVAQLQNGSSRRVSSLVYTDNNGKFTLRLPSGLEDLIDVVAQPIDGFHAPTLIMRDVLIAEAVPAEYLVFEMPSYGDPAPFMLPVAGTDGSGDTRPIAGATVRATTELTGVDAPVQATYSASATTDEEGKARLMLIPGNALENRVYQTVIEPPRGAEHSALFGDTIAVGAGDGGTLATIQLERRVSVDGRIRELDGTAANLAAVKVHLSPRFLDSLDPPARVAVDNVALPRVTTSANGRFVLWLDETLAGFPALYDIEFQSSDKLGASLTIRDIDIGRREGEGFGFGDIDLPDASYARGIVEQADGRLVVDAELHLLEIAGQCVLFEPELGCSPPRERGMWTSDENGEVMMILPRL